MIFFGTHGATHAVGFCFSSSCGHSHPHCQGGHGRTSPFGILTLLMPTLVHIGAGNIGRGFVAPLFTASGWEVVFVDVNQRLVDELNRRGRYQVTEVDNDGASAVVVSPVRALHGADVAAVAATMAAADLVSTAVGLGVLDRLGGVLAAAAQARGGRPLDVLVCENGLDAHERLRAAVVAVNPQAAALLGFVRTSIGRMIPAPEADADLLDIAVEIGRAHV